MRFPEDLIGDIDARAREDKVSFNDEVRRLVKKQISMDAAAENIIIAKLDGLAKQAGDILTQLTLQWYITATFMEEFCARNPAPGGASGAEQRSHAKMECKEILGDMFKDMKARQKSFFDEVVGMVSQIPVTEEDA